MIGSAIAVLTALVAPVAASGAPTVHFKAAAVPIAGFPGTGNRASAGEALEIEYAISGDEYGGFPPPATGFNLYLPAGTRLHPSAFPTCPDFTLEPNSPAPASCALAKAGPTGEVSAFAAYGKEVVAERATIEARYSTGGALQFFTFGSDPVLLEALLKGHFLPADGEYAELLAIEVPLLETVPGAQDVSVTILRDRFGSAIRSGTKTIYYLRAPAGCPRGYLPFKGEVTFAALRGLPAQTVTSEYHAPCPRPGAAEPQAQPLPGTEGVVTAPSNKVCISKRDFRIHIVHIPHLVYQLVTVEVNGKPVKVLRGKRQSAQIDLRGLPKGTYVARIGVVTTSGRLITGTRTYHTCAAHAIHPKRPPRL